MKRQRMKPSSLSGYYFDATMENFHGLLKAFPKIKIAKNMYASIRFSSYCILRDGILHWSHYRSIGLLIGKSANKDLRKIKFDGDGNIYPVSDESKTLSSRGKERRSLMGYPNYWEYERILKKKLNRHSEENK